MKHIFLVIFLIASLAGCSQPGDKQQASISSSLTEVNNSQTQNASDQNLDTGDTKSSQKIEEKLPESIDIKVPFISQAPLYNWDDLHNEACEEASVLNVILYLQKQTMSASEADQQLVKIVNWQVENFGGHYDLPAGKVKEFIKGYYNRDATVSYDVSIDLIKQELANGNPVIVPAAGRSLGNPNFKTPGPVYHMLVIRGYDDKKSEFITNDVGTRKGDGYRYKYQKLFDAIHNMPKWQQNKDSLDANPDMIQSGKKAMLIIN